MTKSQEKLRHLKTIQTLARGYATATEQKSGASNPKEAFVGVKDGKGNYVVSLIEGDGIGPEISQSIKDIYSCGCSC